MKCKWVLGTWLDKELCPINTLSLTIPLLIDLGSPEERHFQFHAPSNGCHSRNTRTSHSAISREDKRRAATADPRSAPRSTNKKKDATLNLGSGHTFSSVEPRPATARTMSQTGPPSLPNHTRASCNKSPNFPRHLTYKNGERDLPRAQRATFLNPRDKVVAQRRGRVPTNSPYVTLTSSLSARVRATDAARS